MATLPSGATVKISTAERVAVGVRSDSVVFHVSLHVTESAAGTREASADPATGGPQQFISAKLPAGGTLLPRPRLGGDRRRTRFGTEQVWARPSRSIVTPERTIRILRARILRRPQRFRRRIRSRDRRRRFRRRSSPMSTSSPDDVARAAGRRHADPRRPRLDRRDDGAERSSPLVDMLVLPFFTHTVTVPALAPPDRGPRRAGAHAAAAS